ncbi:hypothetical protein IscW_ISCW008204 [Ixodes scapularis]|uniref:Uncharacterized protein n=1 Tax=Ixodes scapularis TaxID=6945 RepID=B7PSY1_IXOSC|nr:hypothetical protein IscW_ISCW008204 [Ixodes scapularis]|eukprot:XP_002403351.1 hypothetical protein IscW_ISCW008204 [Ixodes scapularis]
MTIFKGAAPLSFLVAHCFVTFETEAVMQEVLRNAAKFWLNGRLVTIRNVNVRPDNGPGAGRSPGANPSGDGGDGTSTTPLHGPSIVLA